MFEFLFLEDVQQFGLQFQWYIVYFIEEQGVFVCQFEVVDMLGVGFGECVVFVVEQIVFQQFGGYCCVVYFYYLLIVVFVEVVDSVGDKFFVGVGFVEDQYGVVVLCYYFYLFEYIVYCFVVVDNFFEFVFDIIELFGEGEVFIYQLFFQVLNFVVGEGVIDSD